MPIRAILFDLDGTLLDSLRDIATCCNRALSENGFPTHAIDDYKLKIGNGVRNLIVTALPADRGDAGTVERCLGRYRELYAGHWNVYSRLYPGIAELLDELKGRGLPMAVLSNKPHDFTLACVGHFLGRWDLTPVLGAGADFPHKPDPAAAVHIAGTLGVAPADFAYLGDTDTDILTARRAGMLAVGVLWGLRPESELAAAGAGALIREPREFLPLLG